MKIIVEGLATEYRDDGQGPVLLMLHGWGNSLRSFDGLCATLQGYRIIRLDLPGFGGTEKPPGPWDLLEYVGFVEAFCTKLNVRPDILLGHSLGGRISLKGLEQGKLSCKKLVLIASAGVAKRHTVRNILFATLAKAGKMLLYPLPPSYYQAMRRKLYASARSDYFSVEGMSETFANIAREDLAERAAHITVPTLLIWGADDTTTPLSEGERLHALIGDSKLVVIPSAGHFVHHERTAEVARHIKEFI
jgi:pimeloyl-ACP methyl ester carboxylesterase